VALAATNGFAATYGRSNHSLSAAVIAGEGTGMERDYDWSSVIHAADLDKPEDIGRRAAERALKRLNPRKVDTCKCPVIYDPRVSNGIVRHLAGAINGTAIARGTSFLKSKLNQAVFPASVTIVDDPYRRRGLNSKPVDGEGLAPARRAIVDKGVLTTWILDLRSARQLGLKSTGHAARGTSSPPGPSTTNLWLEPGSVSREALIRDIPAGLYITEMIGSGVNAVTGDYSRGATGFWIDKGELTYPVSEITVAGNLVEMFRNLTAANDLNFRYGTDAPTLRIDGMTLAGL
jgi:PmbA protein